MKFVSIKIITNDPIAGRKVLTLRAEVIKDKSVIVRNDELSDEEIAERLFTLEHNANVNNPDTTLPRIRVHVNEI